MIFRILCLSAMPALSQFKSRGRALSIFGAVTALLLSIALVGCEAQQAQSAQDGQPAPPSQVQGTETTDNEGNSPMNQGKDVVADLETGLRKGMAYGDFRKLVLDRGWEPVANPQCKANMAGEDAEAFCAKNPQLTSCKICDELPELDSCSSDAHCLVRFRHPAEALTLDAVGHGEVQYWAGTGEDAGFRISSWEFDSAGK